MKLGSFLSTLTLGAALLAAPLGAQAHEPSPAAAGVVQAPGEASSVHGAGDSAAALANQVTGAELQHGTATPVEAHGAGHEGAEGEHEACGAHDPNDIITPHITDSRCIDLPYWKMPFVKEVELPRWAPVQLGPVTLDFSPTKHVVMLGVAALLTMLVLVLAARAHVRHSHTEGHPKGFAAGIEAMVLYIRNEVAIPNLGGHGGYKYAPFILTLFFFILFCNLLGLIPYGSTATGNISVTATLAIVTLLVIEFAGMRAQGIHYLNTIFYWNKDLNIVMRVIMFLIMTPVEIVGKLSKPFALAIRLFANMTAGHIVVLALMGLIFAFKSYVIGVAPALMAVAIMMLELFVAFLQAYVFALLASVFIGQIREAHH